MTARFFFSSLDERWKVMQWDERWSVKIVFEGFSYTSRMDGSINDMKCFMQIGGKEMIFMVRGFLDLGIGSHSWKNKKNLLNYQMNN